jgi:4-amino-4-deoxy-L-arabinose transferase-like glycosyltransferase
MFARLYSAFRIPHSALGTLFALMLAASWRRWTSVVADSGRETDLPARLAGGELLYRDVHYIYPPLSPYLNAFLYRVFGVHLDVLNASGMVCAALVVWLCYRVARRVLSPTDAALAAGAVTVWCVFRPAGNLIAPYAFAALHGMIFALAALLTTLGYADSGRRRELIVTGLLIGLAAVTKQEFALTAATTLAAAVAFVHRANWKVVVKELSIAALPALLVALPVYALFVAKVGWRTLVEDCHLLYTHLPPSLVYYNAQRTGLDRPLSSLMQLLGGAAIAAMIVSALVALSLLVARRRKATSAAHSPRLWLICGFTFFAAGAGAWAVKAATHGRWDGSPLRALPLLLAALLVWQWRRKESAALFIITAYSLVVLARVALRVPSGGAFGGFFLPTSLILITYLLTEALPRFIERHTQNADAATRLKILARSFLLLMLVSTAVIFGVRFRRNYSFEIVAARGHLFATEPVGLAVREALDFLAANTAPGEAVAVVPEGSDITFLAGRTMPLRHQILIPGLMSEADEARAIELLGARRVRYVLVVNRPMREFGAEAFGGDFYTSLGAWIEKNYRVVKVCGPVKDERLRIGDAPFFIKILARAGE